MKRFYVYVAAFGLTTSTALAGGYVAPVIPYEPAYVKPVEKPKFSWTGPYVGVHMGHTKLKLNKSNIVNHGAEVIEHGAVTEIVTTIIPAVTETVEHPEVTEDIVIPGQTITVEVPPGETTVVVPGRTEIVTFPPTEVQVEVPPVIETTEEEHKLWVATDPADQFPGCNHGNNTCPVPVADGNGQVNWIPWTNDKGESGVVPELGWAYETVTTETVIREGYTETVVVPGGSKTVEIPESTITVTTPGGTQTITTEPTTQTVVVREAWTETVVKEPERVETTEITTPAWTEVVRAAYTSTFVQELKESANTYGVFGGYRYQYRNNVVVGVEANYSKSSNISASFDDKVYDFDLNTFSIEAQAGYAYKRILPYVGLGYASTDGDGALMASVGVDYAVTDNVIIGAKYTHYKYDDLKTWNADADTVSVRVGYKF